MSDHRQLALDYAQEHKTHSLEKMKQIISIPSVSTDPERCRGYQKSSRMAQGRNWTLWVWSA